MMSRRIVTTVAAGVLAVTAASGAVAQDEEMRMGDDPAYAQRVEVPEAGIAVSYPPDWDVSVEMEYGQTQAGDPYTGRWYVVRGSHEDDSCSVYGLAAPAMAQDDEPGSDTDGRSNRIEYPTAGVALALPQSWQAIPGADERAEVLLPPHGEVVITRVLGATPRGSSLPRRCLRGHALFTSVDRGYQHL